MPFITSGGALVYDELIRQRIAARVSSRAPGFSQNDPVFEVDRVVLEKAVALFRERSQQYTSYSSNKSWSASSGSKSWNSSNNSGSNHSWKPGRSVPWMKRPHSGGGGDWKRGKR